MNFETVDKIRESLRIERIYREPNEHEIAEFNRFMELKVVTIHDLKVFVSIYQPGHVLRDKPGIDVWIGGSAALAGGPAIPIALNEILKAVNEGNISPWMAHAEYEMLHPFSDGNGRSGRMLWYWQMGALGRITDLGFLHTFYYQTLQKFSRDRNLWTGRD